MIKVYFNFSILFEEDMILITMVLIQMLVIQ